MGLLILFAVAALLVAMTLTLVIVHRMAHPSRKTYATALARNIPTSPSELGLNYVEKRMALPGNCWSTAWTIDGQGPSDVAVVIIHGFVDSRYGSLLWAPLFVPHAGKIVVYDLRGHGESSQPSASRGLDDVHDMPAVIEQLDLPQRLVFFGYSLGTGVALAAAATLSEEQPDRVAGVILDGAYRFGREPLAGHLRQHKVPTQPFVWLIDAWYTLHSGPPARHDRVRFSAKLQCSLLVMHGSRDEICPAESARQIAQAAPQGRFVLFEGAGHLELASRDPQRYRAELDAFFADLVGRQSDSASAAKKSPPELY